MSAEENFLTSCDKTYFVFTDAEKIFAQENPHVRKIYQENLGWPEIAVFRYKIFKSQLAQLQEFDYMFFLNANTKFMQKVGEEILPPDEIGLLVVQHPGQFYMNNLQFTYDRNPQTHAYIPYGTGKFYVAGGFNGGTRDAFTQAIKTIDEWAQDDYSRGQIPVWHDESYLNWSTRIKF